MFFLSNFDTYRPIKYNNNNSRYLYNVDIIIIIIVIVIIILLLVKDFNKTMFDRVTYKCLTSDSCSG